MTAIASPMPAIRHASRRLALRFDIMRGALALLIIMNVSRFHQHFGWMRAFRPALILTGLAALYAFLAPSQLSTKGLLQTRPAQLTLAFFIFSCLSAPFGLSLGASGTFILSSYSKVIFVALLLIAAIRDIRDLYTFTWAYVAGCGILAYFSIFVFGLSTAGSEAARLGNLYTFDANDVGLIMVVGLPLTILVMQSAGWFGRLLAGVILVGIWVTLARTGSRGAFVALIATGLALLLLLRTVPVVKRLAFVLVTGVTLLLAAPPGYWDQMSTILRPKEDYNWSSEDGRREVGKRGISYMLSYPVFGLGINNFYRAECIDPVSVKVRFHKPGTGIRCSAPHNSYIQAGAELGISGLALWLALVFGGIGAMLRLRRSMPSAWRLGDPEQRFLYQSAMYIAVALVGFAVGSFFVSFAWNDIIYTLAALMAGLIVAVDLRLAQARQGPAEVPTPSEVARLSGPGRRGRLPSFRPSVHYQP